MNRYKAFVLLVIAATALVGFDYNMNIHVPASYKFNNPTVRVQAAAVAASTGTGTGAATVTGVYGDWVAENYVQPTWADSSGNGFDLTQATVSKQPVSSGTFVTLGSRSASIEGNYPGLDLSTWTVAVRVRGYNTNPVTEAEIVTWYGGSPTRYVQGNVGGGGTTFAYFYYQYTPTGGITTTAFTGWDTESKTYFAWHDGSSCYASIGTGTANTAVIGSVAGATKFTIGGASGGTGYTFMGDYSWVKLYNRVLTADERAILTGL